MNATNHRRQSAASWFFIGTLFLLCAFLAHLQYRWIGEVSAASSRRLHENLQASLKQFSVSFDSGISAACRAILPESLTSEDGADGFSERDVADRYRRWERTGPNSQLFSRIAVAEPHAEKILLRNLDLRQATFNSVEWPAEWQILKERLQARWSGTMSMGPGGGLQPRTDGSVFEVPIFEARHFLGPPFGHHEAAWLIFELNLQYVRETLVPALLQRHVAAGGEQEYQVEIITRTRPPTVIYQSDPAADKIARAADASVNLFEVRFDEILRRRQQRPFGAGFGLGRGMGAEGGRWQMLVRHRSGSLEDVVALIRIHNLLVTGAILLLILASAAALLLFTRRAQRLAQLQMEFVAGVSHELRTPLTVIHTAAYNLQGRMAREPAQVERYGALIQQESGRLKDLVEQVMQFAGTQAGRVFQDTEPLSVEGVIDETLEANKNVIHDSHCMLEKNIEPALPRIMGDATALKHALQNLVGNAAKYGAAGGWIGISAKSAVGPGSSEVEIRVADRGPGIPSDEQAHIFDPFYRGKRALRDQVHGTGLGLSLAKRIVEAHGGTIRVQSGPATGTEFIVRVPAAPMESENEFIDSVSRG